jgi:hypothetical protein
MNLMMPISGRMLTENGQVVNIVDILGGGFAQPVSGEVYDVSSISPHSGRVVGEDGRVFNIADLLAAMPGVAKVVYSNDQVILNKAAGTYPMIDMGLELKDGAIYEFVISAMDGSLGTDTAVGNVVLPTFFVDGVPAAAIGAELISTSTYGYLKHYYNFRAQFKRNNHADDESLLLTITPTSGAVGHAYCVDDATAAGLHVDAIQGENTRFMQLLSDPQLVNMPLPGDKIVTIGVINLGISEPSFVSDGLDMRLLVKVTERTSGSPIM